MRTIFVSADKLEGFAAVLSGITLSTMGSEEFQPALRLDGLNLRMVKINDIVATLATTVMFKEHPHVDCNFHTAQANEVCGIAVIAEYTVLEDQLSEMTVVALDKHGKALPDYCANKYTLGMSLDFSL